MSAVFNRVSRQVLQTSVLCLACIFPVVATSALIGIDGLSESHRIWGSAGADPDDYGSKKTTYDISSSHGPIEFQAEGMDGAEKSFAWSRVGSFSALTYGERFEGYAYAESQYIFSPRFDSLIIDVDAGTASTHGEVDMSLGLFDLTQNRGMFFQEFTWLLGDDPFSWQTSFSLLFDVNPQNRYALDLYVSAWGGDSEEGASLVARPSSVAVPEPGAVGLLLGGLLALFYVGARRRSIR